VYIVCQNHNIFVFIDLTHSTMQQHNKKTVVNCSEYKLEDSTDIRLTIQNNNNKHK